MSSLQSVHGGRIRHFIDNWQKITDNQFILDSVLGVKLDFYEIPSQPAVFSEFKFAPDIQVKISLEIERFLTLGIIEPSIHEADEIISNIFCRPKKNGKIRIIGNFKDLNIDIVYQKFKQSTIEDVFNMITPGCYMTSIDLKDAYYSVSIAKQDRKYLKFSWDGKLYQFTCLGQGISSAPRIFTEIMRVPVSVLRQLGINICAYIDDVILVCDFKALGRTECRQAAKLLEALGWIVNYDKSVLEPDQTLVHLGLNFNSVDMTARLTEEKRDNIISLCRDLLECKSPSIRAVARVIGTMVSYSYGAEMGMLHYRSLEHCKSHALVSSAGDFDAKMCISEEGKVELKWWIENVRNECYVLRRPPPAHVLTTDASLEMWGAVFEDKKTGGFWNQVERTFFINALEMTAILFGLMALCAELNHTHVRVMTDSITAVSYINKKGGCKSMQCNRLACKIWKWCNDRQIYISAAHIPGKDNIEADFLSRNQDSSTEWSLSKTSFEAIIDHFGVAPTIDAFASRINNKVHKFVAWKPDPLAFGIDIFLQPLGHEFFWAFPPFNQIGKFLKKVREEGADGIIIAPNWPSQVYYSNLLSLLVDFPIMIRWRPGLLLNPRQEEHPMGKKLRLLGCYISGSGGKRKVFQRKLHSSSGVDGRFQHSDNTKLIIRSGYCFANGRRLAKLKSV